MIDNLGPYEIRGELGRGAMAIVWRAWDPKLEREVAIKEPVLQHGLDARTTEEMGERFVREGRAAGALSHPGIVTIYSADVYDGRPCIVMELIDGEPLSQVLDGGPLPPGAVLSVMDQLLDAVAYAHARGVVHRDIKPDNVFITSEGRIKLTDFGIAHVGSTGGLTLAGTVMGTPGYMAPEQVTGMPVDGRTDLFAIGAMGYEMLSGRNPFGASEGQAPTTVMYRLVHDEPAVLPADVDAVGPVSMSAVLATALAKDPAHRFASAEAFRAALSGSPIVTASAADAGMAVPVAPAPTLRASLPAQQQSSRGWLPWALVGGAAVVALVVMMMMASTPQTSGGGATSVTPPPTTLVTEEIPGDEPETEPTDITFAARLSASSVLDGSIADYGPDNLVDDVRSTCWAEGVGKWGVGESVTFDFTDPVRVSGMKFVPGYDKKAGGWDRWFSNGRLKRARVEMSDGTVVTVALRDARAWQTVVAASPGPVTWVRVTIEAAYPAKRGKHYAEDTSVSEMRVLGWVGP